MNHIVTQERKNYGTTNKPVNGTSINHQSSINQQSIKGRFSQLYQRYVYTNQNEIKGLFYWVALLSYPAKYEKKEKYEGLYINRRYKV